MAHSKKSLQAPGEASLSDELSTGPDSHRELTDLVPAILWRADAQTFRFTFVSSYAETLLGYPLHRWTDGPAFWRDHIYSEDREWVVARRRRAIEEGGDYDLEYRMVS